MNPTPLEPVTPDPRKLRRTAFILFLIMLVGGVGVTWSYTRLLERQSKDPRPEIGGRLTDNLAVQLQDGSVSGLDPLSGKVWVAAAVSVNQPESWQRTREVMQRLAKRYENNPDFHLVCFTVDPDVEKPPVLAEAAEKLGAKLPQWWFAAAGKDYVHKYLKDRFKLGTIPYQKDGKWVYNPKILVIDRSQHLRFGKVKGAVVEFDFDAAAGWDAQGRSNGLEKSNVETMEDILVRTIDQVMAETPAVQKKSYWYVFALLLAGIAVLIWLKRRNAP